MEALKDPEKGRDSGPLGWASLAYLDQGSQALDRLQPQPCGKGVGTQNTSHRNLECAAL